jgi:outer membrane translocation and assembly module TamA
MLRFQGENKNIVSRNVSTGLTINRRLGLNYLIGFSSSIENNYLMPRFPYNTYLKHITYNYFTSSFDYQINTLDSKHFPDKGLILNISASTSRLMSGNIKTEYLKTVYKDYTPGNFDFDRFFTLYGNMKQYFNVGNKLTIALRGDALFISQCDSISAQNNFFLLGGFESLNKRSIPMIGFHANEIPIKKLIGIKTEFDLKLYDEIHLDLSMNIFAAQEAERDKGLSILAGYGIGVGYMSIIGPIKAGLMQGKYRNEKYFKEIKGYLSIGYNF